MLLLHVSPTIAHSPTPPGRTKQQYGTALGECCGWLLRRMSAMQARDVSGRDAAAFLAEVVGAIKAASVAAGQGVLQCVEHLVLVYPGALEPLLQPTLDCLVASPPAEASSALRTLRMGLQGGHAGACAYIALLHCCGVHCWGVPGCQACTHTNKSPTPHQYLTSITTMLHNHYHSIPCPSPMDAGTTTTQGW